MRDLGAAGKGCTLRGVDPKARVIHALYIILDRTFPWDLSETGLTLNMSKHVIENGQLC